MRNAFAAAVVASTLWTPTPASADSVTATIVVGHPPVIRWTRMFPEAFIPAVRERLQGTEHDIAFVEQYGGTIAGAGEELETIESGLAEMGVCNTVVEPDKLSLQSVSYYAPFVSADARLVNETLDALNKTDPGLAESYADNGVVYLGGPIGLDDYLLMTKGPVAGMSDLEGLKIAAPGAAVNWLSGTGAVGVAGNLTLYYNDLKAGVYDGVIVFATGIIPSKLHEVASHITLLGLGAQYAGGICANADWFADLPEEVQTAMRDAADDTKAWYLDDLETSAETALVRAAELGATVTTAAPEMRERWAASMDDAAGTWAETLDARGQPASQLLSTYMAAMREAGARPLRNWDEE